MFHGDADYQTFVLLLSQTVVRFELPLASYCIMPNHWHLVVKPASHDQLSKSLHWLTATHAMRLSRMHPRQGPGPVYQGRFKAIPVQSGLHLLRVLRYVERNALRAGLARRAEEWPWGSASQRLQRRNIPPLLPLQFLPSDEWIALLNEATGDNEVAAAVRENRPYASDEWVKARMSAFGLTSRRRGRPKKTEK